MALALPGQMVTAVAQQWPDQPLAELRVLPSREALAALPLGLEEQPELVRLSELVTVRRVLVRRPVAAAVVQGGLVALAVAAASGRRGLVDNY